MKKTAKIVVALLVAMVMVLTMLAAVACNNTDDPCKDGHKLKAVQRKEATTEAAGYEAYWECENCHKLFSDSEGKNEIQKPVEIQKLDPAAGKYGVETAPISVAQALALADEECASPDDFTQKVVYATGKVFTQPAYNTKGYYEQFTFQDLTDTDRKIIVYTMSNDANAPAPDQNDTIVLKGYIKNHQGTIEFSSYKDADNNYTYVQLLKNTKGTSTITLNSDNGATVNGLNQSGTNGSEISFTVTPNQGRKIVSVKANDTVLTAANENSYKFTLHGNVTVKIETADENAKLAEKLQSVHLFNDASGDDNQYISTYTATNSNGLALTVYGFSTNNHSGSWGNARCGRKGNDQTGETAATISTKTAIEQQITKIVVKVDAMTKEVTFVNSFKLIVASNADFSTVVETVELTMKVGENEFQITNPGKGYYYKIVVDSNQTGANGCYQFSTIDFWGLAD